MKTEKDSTSFKERRQ